MKEVLEYNWSIHQLKIRSQELLAYEFAIIHQPSKMMEDVDAVSRYINTIINKYLFIALLMREIDVRQRPFAYNFDVLFNCSSPRHVRNTDLLPEHTTVPTVPTPLIIYHNPIRFLYHILLFLANQPLPFFRVLLFRPKTLRGYH